MVMCQCCCNIINKLNIVICNNCNYICCKSCCNIFFLSLSSLPKCMNCNINIDVNTLFNIFSIKWIFNKYEQNKEKLLIEKQFILLNKTKKDADRNKKQIIIKNKYKDLLKQRKKINQEIFDLKIKLKELKNVNTLDGDDVYMDDISIEGEVVDIRGEVVDIGGEVVDIGDEVADIGGDAAGVDDFIASYKCKSLFNIVGIVKKCPCCFEYLSKGDGCDTVKCIKCYTVFNWNSGEIKDNQIYNMSEVKIPELMLDGTSLTDSDIDKIKGIYNNVIEFIRYKMKFFLNILSSNKVSGEDKYKLVRINYINGSLTKNTFIKKIKKVNKYQNYRMYISKLILLAYENAISIFKSNINNQKLLELENIIDTTNKHISKITMYLHYSNNIKIYQWFNLNDEKKLLI